MRGFRESLLHILISYALFSETNKKNVIKMFNNKWNTKHKSNWNPELELDENGFTGFQLKLIKQIKDLLQ